ncbi:hypothetical protein NKL07_31425 [Mesorhizobium sp. C280B]|uniref:hypothetical protein n=1 Tax=unclassified Mesorhizobium TaxID=325217 RepID=UPI0003CF15D0|nr:hypothetical protein [Mesorhizobium sp. LSJC280B00]ESW79621.1 hypothetical protein X772_26610 [Mesorhizobium sp. LSJC280B00]
MNVWTNCRPDKVTAEHLVHELILQARRGQIISVKETIAAVRRDGPHLAETDCELVELIVNVAPAFGLFVGFDLCE